MKKYLKLLGFAFKEHTEYRLNFIAGIFTMMLNDSLFVIVYILFLGYFGNVGLTLGSFLLMSFFNAMYRGIYHGIFANIGVLSQTIENGRLDYFLGFPVDTLKLLMTTKVEVHGIGDVLFATICAVIYGMFYASDGGIFAIKIVFVAIFGVIFNIGFTLLCNSLSFWFSKGSDIYRLIESFNLVLGSYPPEVFEQKRVLFILISIAGLFPQVYLPYYIVTRGGTFLSWSLFIAMSLAMITLGIFVFRRGLRKYTSGNLVLQS